MMNSVDSLAFHNDIVAGKTAVVVAHPDDETLWAGGLLARYAGLDVICCSIPARDPERAICFFKAMKLLGHHPVLLPFSEQSANIPLGHLSHLDLSGYETIITHNAVGEYGHLHHKQVHDHVVRNFDGKIYCFGLGEGRIILPLSDDERAKKMAALQCYNNQSVSDGGLQKWDALLKKYSVDFDHEQYKRALDPGACGTLSNDEIRARADYQIFNIEGGSVLNPGSRMQKKLQALTPVLPKFDGLRVLDIGCDFGFWSFSAAVNGAAEVVALDRSREVKGLGHVNLPLLNNQTADALGLNASFFDYEVGTQWWDLEKFDVVFCMSLYHHIYNLCRDHNAIWYWLSRVTGGQFIWENPVDVSDDTVRKNVDQSLWPSYTEKIIREAAAQYFDIDYEGPAIHEDTRVVWRMRPKKLAKKIYRGAAQSGSGGATKAFVYMDKRRIREIQNILGRGMLPGSLNLVLDEDFDWNAHYVRARLLDVVDRQNGLDGAWAERWVRFYPVLLGDVQAWAMRFEGEKYSLNFLELISDHYLRAQIGSDKMCAITLAH